MNTQMATVPTTADLLRYKLNTEINRVIATYLSILEELGSDHDEAISKLRAALPEHEKPYADLLCYFSEDKYEIVRARVLRAANDARREIEAAIDNSRI